MKYNLEIRKQGGQLTDADILEMASHVPYSEPYPAWTLNLSEAQQTQMMAVIETAKTQWQANQKACEDGKPLFMEWFGNNLQLMLRVAPFTKTERYQPQPVAAPWFWSKRTVNVVNLRELGTEDPLAIAYLIGDNSVYSLISHLKEEPDMMVYRFRQKNNLSKTFNFDYQT